MTNQKTKLSPTDIHLLKHKFPAECEAIPTTDLSEHEKELVQKCLKREMFTRDEFLELSALLKRFRAAIHKYAPMEEAFKKTERIINSEKELLDLINNQERYKLQMKYRIQGEEYILNLRVNPLSTSQSINEMQSHMELFKELTTQERVLSDKAVRGELLSPEEAKMLEAINRKLEEKIYNVKEKSEQWDEFLARQVEFENCSLTTFEEKKSFWSKIEPTYKVSLYNKVRDILNLTEAEDEDLFL